MKQKIVYILPAWFPYIAMQIWKYTLTKKGKVLNKRTLQHELIHYHQQKELFIIFFFVIYLFEFLIKFMLYLNWRNAYQDISFEREAYENEMNYDYLSDRKKYAWLNYLV